MKNIFLSFIIVLFTLPFSSNADDTSTSEDSSTPEYSESLACPSMNLFDSLFDKICWDCILPIHIAGVGAEADAPDGASTQFGACSCDDPNGIPRFGIPTPLWKPSKIQEVVRTPNCYPSLGGVRMSTAVTDMGGKGEEKTPSELSHYQSHYYAFPITAMLEMFQSSNCGEDFVDMDLINASEFFPDWGDDELAFYMAPESAALALIIPTCVADCAAATLGKPLESMFYCAGCWGGMYPLNGNNSSNDSMPSNTSLIATRMLARQHRMGLAKKTIGDRAMCGAYFSAYIPKSQYKYSMMFPIAEASPSCCHAIGASTYTWGEWRNIPAKGEDAVYIQYGYRDCCLLY